MAILTSQDHSRTELGRKVAAGELQRLADGIYSDDVRARPEDIVARDWAEILARVMPGAIITYRSAFEMRPAGGELHVSHPRRVPLKLPGLIVYPDGTGRPSDDDFELRPGIYAVSPARALIDNSHDHPGRPSKRVRRLDRGELHDQIIHLAQTTSPERLDAILADVARRAPTKVGTGIAAFVRAARAEIATVDSPSRAMRAAQRSEGFDQSRVERFRKVAARLADLPPARRPIVDPQRVAQVPFYEAYFSNFIEGTEFTLEEAERIVFEGEDLGRPDDAHDISGTFEVVSGDAMRDWPVDADEFLQALQDRHAVMMRGRPDKTPGRWKRANNRAGITEFVDWQLVPGTLRAGWEEGEHLTDPFHRAAYAMFLVSEVHPFVDGNGRSARVAMNNALAAADEHRIVIPTILRSDYLSALVRTTADNGPDGLHRILDFAQRWVARGDWRGLDSSTGYLEATNALMDSRRAEAEHIYLEIPAWSAIQNASAQRAVDEQPRGTTERETR